MVVPVLDRFGAKQGDSIAQPVEPCDRLEVSLIEIRVWWAVRIKADPVPKLRLEGVELSFGLHKFCCHFFLLDCATKARPTGMRRQGGVF
jgi:hypothetical protein